MRSLLFAVRWPLPSRSQNRHTAMGESEVDFDGIFETLRDNGNFFKPSHTFLSYFPIEYDPKRKKERPSRSFFITDETAAAVPP